MEFSELIRPNHGTPFSELRPAQETVLQLYSQSSHELSDVAIELPTGAGKTLIALLVLEYWRNHQKKVAILTGNKTLARQLEAEARNLNVPIVRFEGSKDNFPAADKRKAPQICAIYFDTLEEA